jgi:hypothetical protein
LSYFFAQKDIQNTSLGYIFGRIFPCIKHLGTPLKNIWSNCSWLQFHALPLSSFYSFLPGSIARWRLDQLSVPVSTLVPAFELAAADPGRSVLSDTLSNVPSLVTIR